MDELKTNVLYYGDNLQILRKYIPGDSVDLIYLDPPFSSKRDYNITFKVPRGKGPEAQITEAIENAAQKCKNRLGAMQVVGVSLSEESQLVCSLVNRFH